MGHEVDDPLGDPLDRDLEALLAAEPSGEFVARVRTRVATETFGRRWRVFPRAWSLEPLLAVGFAVIVLAVVIPVWLRPEAPGVVDQPTVPTLPVQQQAHVDQLKPDTSPELQAPDIAGHRVRGVRLQPDREVRGARLQAAPSDAPPFAEVLVSEDEQRAFAMLLKGIAQGRVPPEPAAVAAAASIEPPAIQIPDLVIEPLPQIAALE